MSYIKLENVSKSIKGTSVLKNVNMLVGRGEVIGLTGINGSGKSMLLRAIAGLIHVDGLIEIEGEPMKKGQIPDDMGVLIETPEFISEFTGRQNLQLLGMLQDGVTDNDVDDALEAVGLNPKDKRKYRKYSLGMRERLAIAQAVLKEPKLILLDEPTNGIDGDGIGILKKLLTRLKENGSTIIIASHDKDFLQEVQTASYEMREGEIV